MHYRLVPNFHLEPLGQRVLCSRTIYVLVVTKHIFCLNFPLCRNAAQRAKERVGRRFVGFLAVDLTGGKNFSYMVAAIQRAVRAARIGQRRLGQLGNGIAFARREGAHSPPGGIQTRRHRAQAPVNHLEAIRLVGSVPQRQPCGAQRLYRVDGA